MLIADYFSELHNAIADFTSAGFLTSAELLTEARSDEVGYIRGSLVFSDGSILHFREYVALKEGQIEKLSYAYHFQNPEGELIFRYDNARHRPPVQQAGHKHTPEGVTPSTIPTLREVLLEIVARLLAK